MRVPTATRTTNPLPFQDLEPKRFEDLVRQLAYEFRPWRRLEATGRSGADEGFDARGLEVMDLGGEAELLESTDDESEAIAAPTADRLWLIQCKRERAIGPTKAATYLEAIVLSPEEPLHGLILAAPCDFSKRTRDTIFSWCRVKGIAEVHVWGRGELEDMLFQPKNDNLLFAYFGISLTIRRRTLTSEIRAELATKRRLKKTVMTSSAAILVRDPAAVDYPEVEPGKRPTQWWVFTPEELSRFGLMVSVKWHYAYLDRATGEWDAADAVSSMTLRHPWRIEVPKERALDEAAGAAWNAFPEINRGWLRVSGFIPFRNIIAIDEIGDDVVSGTHLYVPFHRQSGPFEGGGFWTRLTTTSHWEECFEALPDKRIEKFSENVRRSLA